MSDAQTFRVYGAPPPGLADAPTGAGQVSPLIPGSQALEEVAPATLSGMVVAAPPGVLERRQVLALALRALRPGAPLTALAPKDKGGARLRKELEAFGCAVEEHGRAHQRICRTVRPPAPTGLEAAVAAGALQRVEALDLWSRPGVFSWNKADAGTSLLVGAFPELRGRGADLGCGSGVLARAALASPAVTRLDLVDIDRRAVEAARRNLDDPRAHLHWADARVAPPLDGLDFVVANPPFHDDGAEDRGLGQAFLRRAQQVLRPGGTLWAVANRHLPYEGVLSDLFAAVRLRAEAGGFKVYEARR